ncbi:hypothetical protein [uncultured Flavobacterium sp.]|uniref:hypothetical protein n=1 Tax=uncultured Flavobacterium sp. TaxID=165435 RepID=UPI00121B0A59|nr:hypothetical protein [uncultured Flavobacterium sp.]THD33333.1 MAG: hypothetical protein DI588_05195 [Flavobacterium johnsoniae]
MNLKFKNQINRKTKFLALIILLVSCDNKVEIVMRNKKKIYYNVLKETQHEAQSRTTYCFEKNGYVYELRYDIKDELKKRYGYKISFDSPKKWFITGDSITIGKETFFIKLSKNDVLELYDKWNEKLILTEEKDDKFPIEFVLRKEFIEFVNEKGDTIKTRNISI